MKSYPALTIRVSPDDDIAMDLVAAALDGFDVFAIDEPEPGLIRAFFGSSAMRDRANEALSASRPDWLITPTDVPDEGWAERSQAGLKAVSVGRLVIAPPWDLPEDGSLAQTIVILPSMGFGTGHHATTRLCLQALQELDVTGKSVLDVGTGSGVLALASARLGATDITGIDNDPDAIANAIENLKLNGLTSRVRFEQAGLEEWEPQRRYDVATANLTGQMLIRFSDLLRVTVGASGHLVVSGLLEEEEDAVRAAFQLPLVDRRAEGGWASLIMRAQP